MHVRRNESVSLYPLKHKQLNQSFHSEEPLDPSPSQPAGFPLEGLTAHTAGFVYDGSLM